MTPKLMFEVEAAAALKCAPISLPMKPAGIIYNFRLYYERDVLAAKRRAAAAKRRRK